MLTPAFTLVDASDSHALALLSSLEPARPSPRRILIVRHDSSTSLVYDSCQRGQYEDVDARPCPGHKNVERGEIPPTAVSPCSNATPTAFFLSLRHHDRPQRARAQ